MKIKKLFEQDWFIGVERRRMTCSYACRIGESMGIRIVAIKIEDPARERFIVLNSLLIFRERPEALLRGTKTPIHEKNFEYKNKDQLSLHHNLLQFQFFK